MVTKNSNIVDYILIVTYYWLAFYIWCVKSISLSDWVFQGHTHCRLEIRIGITVPWFAQEQWNVDKENRDKILNLWIVLGLHKENFQEEKMTIITICKDNEGKKHRKGKYNEMNSFKMKTIRNKIQSRRNSIPPPRQYQSPRKTLQVVERAC